MYRWRIVCYPWDLADEGAEAVLDLLVGELGVTDLVVPLQSGRLDLLRRRPSAAGKRLQSEGGCHFKPELRRYATSRIKPPASDQAREFGFLEKLAQLCADRRLGFIVRLSARSIPALAAKHAECCARDGFGNPWNRLCPFNAEVADFLRLQAEELKDRFSPTAIEWADLMEGPTYGLDAAEPGRLGELGRCLLSFCTCAACRQIGLVSQVDVTTASEAIQKELTALIEVKKTESRDIKEWVSEYPAIQAWMAAKNRVLDVMITGLEKASGCTADLLGSALALQCRFLFPPRSGQASSGSMICIASGAFGPDHSLDEQLATFTAKNTLGFQIPLFDPLRPDGSWLNQTLVKMVDQGIAPIDLCDLGSLPLSGQAALRQAIRFARRTEE